LYDEGYWNFDILGTMEASEQLNVYFFTDSACSGAVSSQQGIPPKSLLEDLHMRQFSPIRQQILLPISSMEQF
jgi:hypothetical protein